MELRNSDDEALILSADGLLVWLSHPGINKAVVIRQVQTLNTSLLSYLSKRG